MAAPAFQSASDTIITGAATSVAVPVPSGVAANDVILVGLYVETTGTVTPPAGFTEKSSASTTASGEAHTGRVFWKRATGADSGTYTFSWAATVFHASAAMRISGCITTGDPIGSPVNTAVNNSGAGTTTPAVATLTPDRDNCLVFFFGTGFDGGPWTPPSGFTERVDNGFPPTFATLTQTTTASTGSVTATCSSAVGRTGTVGYLLPVPVSATVSATVVVSTAAVPAPAVQTGSTVSATTVAATGAVPAPSVVTPTVAPATVVSTVTVPAPTITTGSKVSATTVAAIAAVPAPTVTGTTAATVSAITVAAIAAVPHPLITVPGPAFPGGPLGLRVELDIAGAWADISGYVYQRDGVRISRGRQDEGSDVNPTSCFLTLDNRDGRFSPRNPTGAYYGLIGRNSQLRVSVLMATGWLRINQVTGDVLAPVYVSTTDKAALDITGDIDVRFDADLDSWRDSMELIGKWTETGNQRSWTLILNVSGTVTLYRSNDGSAVGAGTSTVPIPVTNGRIAVRATLDVNNGSGGKTTTFYVADTIAGTWAQLGDPVVAAGTTSLFSGTSPLYLLDNPGVANSNEVIRGRIYAAQVYNGIAGTRVAAPDFTIQTEGVTSFADAHSNTWTLTGDLDLTRYDTRFVGEVASFPQRWDVTGRDIYSPVEAYGVLRRLAQGSVVGSSIYRGIIRDPLTLSYWAMEDASGATFFSGVGGGNLRANGADPAGESGFVSSDPVAVIGATALAAIPNTYVSTGETTVKMLMHVPDAGVSATTTLFTVTTAGTAPVWDVVCTTGGSLSIVAKDGDGATITTIGPNAFAVNGRYMQIKLILENQGADVQADLTVLFQNTETIFDMTGIVSSRQTGRVTRITLNPRNAASMEGVAVGHLALNASLITTFDEEVPQVNGWAGETATDRIARLCAEEGVAFCPIGPRGDGDSSPLGVQTSAGLLDLLRTAARADDGILFEGRDFLELRYRPRLAIYSQQSDVTLGYTDHQMDEMVPVEDDQQTENDVTVSRVGGGSSREELTVGPLSTDIPPVGVGRYDQSYSLSLEEDRVLPDHAGWRLHKGTVDEARFPRVDLSLESGHFTGIFGELARMDLGDRITILAQPAWIDQREIHQLIQGYTEELNAFRRGFGLNLSPASPWDVGVWNDFYEEDRYGNGACTTAEALDTTETGVDVLTGTESQRWSATAVPYDVIIGGEIMTVTAVTGSTNTQTLTCTRSVNGVVKSHLTGQTIELATLSYYGL